MEDEVNIIGRIQEEFSNELVTKSSDLAIDYLQLGLDTVFNSTILEEVPVVKTIAATYKMGLAIKERFFAKKLLAFIVDLRNGTCDESRKNKFITKMQDSGYRHKVTETLLVFIDSYTSLNKALMVSRIFNDYINGKYNWEKFLLFSNCIDLLFVDDIHILEMFYKTNEKIIEGSNEIKDKRGSLHRLVHLGFLNSEGSNFGVMFGQNPVVLAYTLSQDGQEFFESVTRNGMSNL